MPNPVGYNQYKRKGAFGPPRSAGAMGTTSRVRGSAKRQEIAKVIKQARASAYQNFMIRSFYGGPKNGMPRRFN